MFDIGVLIKKNKKDTKFKIRRGRHLYTFKSNKDENTKRIQELLESNQYQKTQIKNRIIKKKTQKK